MRVKCETKDKSDNEWVCEIHKAYTALHSGLCTGSRRTTSGRHPGTYLVQGGVTRTSTYPDRVAVPFTYSGEVKALDKTLQLCRRRRKAKELQDCKSKWRK
jgi:hypothetical protein